MVHPCFLYESIWCLLGFVLLTHFHGASFVITTARRSCSMCSGTASAASSSRGIRTDSLIIPGTGLRVSQVVALVSVVAAIVLLIVFRSRTSLSGCGSKRSWR